MVERVFDSVPQKGGAIKTYTSDGGDAAKESQQITNEMVNAESQGRTGRANELQSILDSRIEQQSISEGAAGHPAGEELGEMWVVSHPEDRSASELIADMRGMSLGHQLLLDGWDDGGDLERNVEFAVAAGEHVQQHLPEVAEYFREIEVERDDGSFMLLAETPEVLKALAWLGRNLGIENASPEFYEERITAREHLQSVGATGDDAHAELMKLSAAQMDASRAGDRDLMHKLDRKIFALAKLISGDGAIVGEAGGGFGA